MIFKKRSIYFGVLNQQIMVARFVGNFYKLESWLQDIPYMILGNETKLGGMCGMRIIGLSMIQKM